MAGIEMATRCCCAGAFADGTALAAAAAGDGFFSPLSGGVLAPLQQQRLATPDLSPHARRRQLDPERQVIVALLRASSLCTMVPCLHLALGAPLVIPAALHQPPTRFSACQCRWMLLWVCCCGLNGLL
jgi:hypothetical protein